MKAIGYVRVSTDEQAKSGLGLEAQIAKIKAYAELFDIELTEIIMDEGISGKTLDREGLQRAIKILKDKKAEGMVIAKLDRLTRNVADSGTIGSTVFDKA